jgi:hypothetical protein
MNIKSNLLENIYWGKPLTAAAVIGFVSCYGPAALAATPTIFMESAAISGAGDALKLARVPVQKADGTVIYKDISMLFDVDNSGNVTLQPAFVRITASPTLVVGAFKPGTYNGYVAYYTGNPLRDTTFKVGSPGVGSGGRISGSIQRITVYQNDGFNASWTSGAITGHPQQAKLNAAGITSTAYNWGVMGTAGPFTISSGWKAGDIIGVIQNGNQLSIVNFGIDKNADTNLTFTLCPTANPC